MLFNFELPFAAPAPIAVDPTVGQIAIEAEKAFPSPPLPPPSQEEIRAAEQVFATESAENKMVAGLLGAWMGTALMHDLLVEHLGKSAGEFEEEEQARLKKKQQEEQT